MRKYVWWHAFRKHRLRQDIDRHRMVTVCDCGETWVCIGEGGSHYVRPRTGYWGQPADRDDEGHLR